MAEHEWPESHRKRLREDEENDISQSGTLGFNEHRSKRFHALPLRTSPKSKRWADSPQIPLSSTSFANSVPTQIHAPGPAAPETVSILEQHVWADEPELVSRHSSAMVDCDMDMTDDVMDISEQGQNETQSRPNPIPDHVGPNANGRMPTPIHCSFAAQIRGNNWNEPAGGAMQGLAITPEEPTSMPFGPDNVSAHGFRDGSMMGHESVPRCLDGPAATAQVMADWSMVQNRRLPSPISESGGEDACTESPRMVLDSSPGRQFSQLVHQHPLLAGLQPRNASTPDLNSSGREATPGVGREQSPGSGMDVESPATPSPRKGHTRSKHTVNSWTALQPGMKRSFSIGYRADCEKCRMKVPGHFNHIIIS